MAFEFRQTCRARWKAKAKAKAKHLPHVCRRVPERDAGGLGDGQHCGAPHVHAGRRRAVRLSLLAGVLAAVLVAVVEAR